MPEGSLRTFPRRIMEPLETRPVLAWLFKEMPSLPHLCPKAVGGQWRTRTFAICVRLPDDRAQALATWLSWVQRLDCLLDLDSVNSGRWLVRIAGPIMRFPGPDGCTYVRVDMERVDDGCGESLPPRQPARS